MRQVQAFKYHGYGNNFLLVNRDQAGIGDPGDFASRICDPSFGVGADGCVLFAVVGGSRIDVRIFNRDGSEAGMSGNGCRCAAAHIHRQRLAESDELLIQTASGPKSYRLVESGEGLWTYRSLMGHPRFAPKDIPCAARGVDEVRDYPLRIGRETLSIHALSVGNPQCVLFVEQLPDEKRFRRLGSQLEAHPFFPDRTNVSFVRVEENRLRLRIWERGVGPTHSSGTGSCAAAVAAVRAGLVGSPVEVATETGSQTVRWRLGEEIELTGAAEFIAEILYWRH